MHHSSKWWMSHSGGSHLVPRLHEAILSIRWASTPLSELLPHKFVQSDDSWMPSDRPCICSAVNYSAPSIFTSLREVWKPLASPLSAAPAVSHHQSLVSQRVYFMTDYSEPGDKVFPTWSQRSAVGRSLLPFNRCPWEPVSLSTQFLTDPSAPWQSALSSLIYSNITIDPPSSCSSLLSVTHWLSPLEKLNDSEFCFKLFIRLLFKVTHLPVFIVF